MTGRSRPEIRADIDTLERAARVVFDRATSSGERPKDERVAGLAAEWMGYAARSIRMVIATIIVVGPLLTLGILEFSQEVGLSLPTALLVTSLATGVVGLILWATAYRPIRRRQVSLSGGTLSSSGAENWVIGALIGWFIAWIIGGVLYAIGVRVPAVLGWPLWILIAWACKKALDGQRGTQADEGDGK